MKGFKLIIVLASVLFAGNCFAQKITAGDVSIEKGRTANLLVSIDFAEKAWSGEFNIELPDGFSVAEIKKGELMPAELHAVEIHGTKVIAYPTDFGEDVFSKESGVFTVLTLKVDDSVADGEYTGILKKGSIGDINGFAHDTQDAIFKSSVAGTTGINSVSVDNPNAEIYTVGGRRVDNNAAKKGVYVVNGKKVAVK